MLALTQIQYMMEKLPMKNSRKYGVEDHGGAMVFWKKQLKRTLQESAMTLGELLLPVMTGGWDNVPTFTFF